MPLGGFVSRIKNFAADAIQDQGRVLAGIGGASGQGNEPVARLGATGWQDMIAVSPGRISRRTEAQPGRQQSDSQEQ